MLIDVTIIEDAANEFQGDKFEDYKSFKEA